MEKCLITKLKGVSGNEKLLGIGELGLEINLTKPAVLTLVMANTSVLRIVGNGYFTSKNGDNLGKTFSVPLSAETPVYVSAGKYNLIVPNKYGIGSFRTSKAGEAGYELNPYLDVRDLKFCKNVKLLAVSGSNIYGDFSELKDLKNISFMSFQSPNITGDISVLQDMTGLNSLYLIGCKGITGDIAALKGKNLLYIDLSDTSVYGDISALNSSTNLNHFNCSGVLKGDVSVFKNANGLKYLTLNASTLSGDIAKMPASFFYYSGKGSFSWSSRPSSSKIITFPSAVTIDNVDKMLQDQANCTVPTDQPSVFKKTISVIGNRTSASDSAVATLQSKGYTVSVIPA